MGKHLIGVIADTHGLMRPEVFEVLKDSELIIHAGDIGSPRVLENLRTIAPVVAVRGNIDKEQWATTLPKAEVVEIARTRLYVLHDLHEIDLEPAAAGFSAVISGHSHQPSIQTRKGVLVFNPGSAGPRRFKLPISVGLISIEDGMLEGRIIELKTPGVIKHK
jgi:uncharacterized protein